MKKSKALSNKFIALTMSAVATAAFVAEVPVQAQTNPFTDVKEGTPFYDSIIDLYTAGIVTGVTATTFQPNAFITRGEAALFLANALQLNMNNVINPKFTDVTTSNQYYKAIAALCEQGIMTGYKDGSFKPNNSLTRAQMAKIVTLGFKLQQASSSVTKFKDVNVLADVNAKHYIQTLVNYSITTGTTTTTFSPNAKLTRGQLTQFLARALAIDSLQIIGVE